MVVKAADAAAVLALAGLAAAACGGAGDSGAAMAHGTASVAYASSLEYLNEKVAGPAFTRAERYGYSGYGASAGALRAEIASGEIRPNVFESVGGTDIAPLEPKLTRWYIQYAATSIVVAYNPRSGYASQFRAIAAGTAPLADLFSLMATPGFRLGRTDPNIDPQGRDFIEMLELAKSYYHLPANTVSKILRGPAGSASSPQVYAESSLESTLQSGQLDAASAYLTQAIQLRLPYITLPDAINLGSAALAAQYAKAMVTITPPGGAATTMHGSPQVMDITLIGKPTPAGIAFVRYTLSGAGRAQYRRGGYTVLTPTIIGDGAAVPAAIRDELAG